MGDNMKRYMFGIPVLAFIIGVALTQAYLYAHSKAFGDGYHAGIEDCVEYGQVDWNGKEVRCQIIKR